MLKAQFYKRPAFRHTFLFAAFIVALLVYCAPPISLYSSRAYELAISTKVESLALMDKATEPYSDHRQEIDSLKIKLQKAYEFARACPHNEFSTKQWQIMLAPEAGLLGHFLERWQSDEVLSRTFIDDAKSQVADAFDTIIELESGKAKPQDLGTE